jgi:hypothetical protein
MMTIKQVAMMVGLKPQHLYGARRLQKLREQRLSELVQKFIAELPDEDLAGDTFEIIEYVFEDAVG